MEAIVFAEEHGVTELTSNQMPAVGLFGAEFLRMFRDAIFAGGNYGEIYERNVEKHVPRTGLNLLFNKTNLLAITTAPLRYPMPGMLP